MNDHRGMDEGAGRQPEIIIAEVVSEPPMQPWVAAPVRRRRVRLPVLLFIATCLSTLFVGGWTYAVPLMTILICHEMGHFLQARRYGVHASFPYFIPMPVPPLGTFGAVIGMEARMGDRRALFDIGITGPLAGLVPTLVFCVIGLHWSHTEFVPKGGGGFLPLGEPLLFKWLSDYFFGPLPAGKHVILHQTAYAGWVGLLITALNLMPIGQLDGGHVLYALLRRNAHKVASLLLMAAGIAVMIAVVEYGYFGWILMLFLLMLMGPIHPPTADDHVPLGFGRIVLGWLTLAFIPIGFTPMPFLF